MRVSDVTLREGEQTSGVSYDVDEKIEAGLLLDRLDVDYIQAGFPVIGETEQKVVSELSASTDTTVTAMARPIPGDVEAAAAADADMAHVFATTQERQLEYMIGKSREEVLENWRDAVDLAYDHGMDARIASVDAFRTEVDHLVDLYELFDDVDLVGFSDTVGCRTPEFVTSRLTELEERGVDLDRLSVHFHDDLGLSNANALAAAGLGVGNVDVSVGGVGERAGNTALEEFAAATNISGIDLNVDITQVVPVCREVLNVLGEEYGVRKALLGDEVYRHESGLHTGAMLEEPSVFEPWDPSRFGAKRELVFGETSGRRAAVGLLERADRKVDEATIEALLAALAEQGPMGLDPAIELARGV